MRITWGALGRKMGLKGPEDTVEIADDAAALETVTSANSDASARPDPEAARLREQLAQARRREEARIARDGQSFAALMVRDDKAPPYVAAVLAAEYEAMAMLDLDRPLAEGTTIPVGETQCVTRVEALRERYAQVRPSGHTTQRALDRARTVPNGSAGEPDEVTSARERGRELARQLNGRK